MAALRKTIHIGVGLLLSIVLLLTSVELVAFDLDHYRRSFHKYNITEATGMDVENLEHTTKDLLKYLKDDRQELDTRAVIQGKEREVFGTRERLHMIDVKELFIKGRILRNSSLILLLAFTIFLIKRDKAWQKSLARILLFTSGANIGLILLLILLMAMDFYKYFTYFHLIFFDNDLWILDPRTDILINMVPEAFFYDTAVKILSYFLGSLVVLGLLGLYYRKKNKAQ